MTALFDMHYYRIAKLFPTMVGLWPYQSQSRNKIIRSLNMYILFSYFPPQLKRLYHIWGKDIEAMCTCMSPVFTIFMCLIKNMTIVRFEMEVKMLLRQMETDWEMITNEKECTVLVNHATKTKKLCTMYSIMMCNGLAYFLIAPMISPMLDIVLPRNETRKKDFAFDLDYGFDVQTYWFWVWLHTSIAGATVIFNIVAADVIYITLSIYSCCLFAIVRHKLEHITDSIRTHIAQSACDYNTDSNVCQHTKLKKQAAIIKECVTRHKKAIMCAQLLHCIYTWCHFAAFFLNIITISISTVQLASKMFQWTEMTMSVVYLIGELIHLFFLTLMAQYILDQSEKVHESASTCSWYNLSAKIQKDIILILMRSRSPCKIVAGHMLVMSLETFCTILQSAMSYFTVLSSFQ